MRTLKLVLVWVAYLAICTGLLFALTLAPLPALALYLAGYLLVLKVIIPRFFPAESEQDSENSEHKEP